MVFRRMAKMPGASMRITRTFHVPATASTTPKMTYIDVQESHIPNTICIKVDDMTAYLTRDQFDALCNLRYEVRWAPLEAASEAEAASAPIEELPF